jgi:hypothetical protein
MAKSARIIDRPSRPACPVCRMNMITITKWMPAKATTITSTRSYAVAALRSRNQRGRTITSAAGRWTGEACSAD